MDNKFSLPREAGRAQEKDHSYLIAFAMVFALLSFGTAGYVLIEGWPLLDALYMTVITLSTVGFTEVHQLSKVGRVFTMLLILVGVGGAAYFFSTLMRLIVESELIRRRGKKKMRNAIEKLQGHYVVCGYGRLGKIVVRELLEANQKVVVIDLDPERAAVLEREGALYVIGSAYEDDILLAAGISRARSLLSLLPKDADNVYVTLCARDLHPGINIVCRSEDESGENKVLRAGADQALSPYRITGTRIVQRLIRPHVSDFLELAATKKGPQLVIEEVLVPSSSPLIGKTLEDSQLRSQTGAVIAAIIRSDGEMLFNPGAKSIIEADSTMIVLGERDSLARLSALI